MGPIGCPKTLVKNYHYSIYGNPEENNSHLLHSRSLKSHIQLWFQAFGRRDLFLKMDLGVRILWACCDEPLFQNSRVCPPLHIRHILHNARYAAASQSMNEVFLLIKLSVALVRNSLCSLKMIELSKHVGAN
jgi:hypothetical protein